MHTPSTLEFEDLELDRESFRLMVLKVVFRDLTNEVLVFLLGLWKPGNISMFNA